jgi:ABC-2 type transport system ATP-binding protein
MAAIRAERVCKHFGDVRAVDEVSLEVDCGTVFGFLGPNGAGKTTTMRMLTGVLKPDSGSVHINGIDIAADPIQAKQHIGVIPENSSVYGDLSARENILLTGKFYGISRNECRVRADELLRTMGLADRGDDPVRRFSKGMKQRVSIACAIVHNPGILFLDEPTEGLDVQSKKMIYETIGEIKKDGRTVFLTTHNIEEANTICGVVGIINRGKMVTVDKPEILKSTTDTTRSVEVSFSETVDAAWFASDSVVKITEYGDKLRLFTPDADSVIKELTEVARLRDLTITSLSTSGPSLEETFLKLTGEDA